MAGGTLQCAVTQMPNIDFELNLTAFLPRQVCINEANTGKASSRNLVWLGT